MNKAIMFNSLTVRQEEILDTVKNDMGLKKIDGRTGAALFLTGMCEGMADMLENGAELLKLQAEFGLTYEELDLRSRA